MRAAVPFPTGEASPLMAPPGVPPLDAAVQADRGSSVSLRGYALGSAQILRASL
jgi:hypothetical protein